MVVMHSVYIALGSLSSSFWKGESCFTDITTHDKYDHLKIIIYNAKSMPT